MLYNITENPCMCVTLVCSGIAKVGRLVWYRHNQLFPVPVELLSELAIRTSAVHS